MTLCNGDASSDFFVVGGTMHHNAPAYVERRADHELFEALRGGEFCYALTARQMGKSSLMIRTAARLRETGASVAALDLTERTSRSAKWRRQMPARETSI
jgi:hypothetical protein